MEQSSTRLLVFGAAAAIVVAILPFLTGDIIGHMHRAQPRLDFWGGVRSRLESHSGQVAVVSVANGRSLSDAPRFVDVKYDLASSARARQEARERCARMGVQDAFVRGKECIDVVFGTGHDESIVDLKGARTFEVQAQAEAEDAFSRYNSFLILSLCLAGLAAGLLAYLIRKSAAMAEGDVVVDGPKVLAAALGATMRLTTLCVVVSILLLVISGLTVNRFVPGWTALAILVPVVLLLVVSSRLRAARAKIGEDPELTAPEVLQQWSATSKRAKDGEERLLANHRRAAEALRAARDQGRLTEVLAEVAALEKKSNHSQAEMGADAQQVSEEIATIRNRLHELQRAAASPEALTQTKREITELRHSLAEGIDRLRAVTGAMKAELRG